MMPYPHSSPPPKDSKNSDFGDWRTESAGQDGDKRDVPIELPRSMWIPDDEEPETQRLGFFSRFLRIMAALLVLLPVNALIIYALGHCLGQTSADVENVMFWMRTPIWYSMMGALTFFVIALMGISRRTWLLLYIIGHELTHAVAILLCGGKIKGMSISTTNGSYVLTNKTNIFIALSPYFVPFWMLIWMALVWGMNRLSPFDTYLQWFYAGFGFWWVYHLFWTAYSIVQERQPDLFDNELIFSLLIIVLLNFLLLIGILMLFGLITPEGYLQSLKEGARWAYTHLRPLLSAAVLRL